VSTLAAGPLDEQSRFEMAQNAMATERRNRPTQLLWLCVALLAVTAVAAALGLGSRASAAARLRAEAKRGADVEQLISEFKALQERDSNPSRGNLIGDPEPRLASRMQRLAQGAGMTTVVEAPTEGRQPRVVSGAKGMEYTYLGLREERLLPLLQWVETATKDIPALQVEKISLTRDATAWKMDVTFQRWERIGG
jgi:hypothetical protein